MRDPKVVYGTACPELELKTFTTYMPKAMFIIEEKVITLTEEQNLLGAIGNYYEMSVIVRSLCTNHGFFILPKDKFTCSLPMNMIIDIHGSVEEPEDLPIIKV